MAASRRCCPGHGAGHPRARGSFSTLAPGTSRAREEKASHTDVLGGGGRGGGEGGGGGGGAASMPGRQSLSCWVSTEGWRRVGCQAGNPLCLGGPTIDVIRDLASALSDGDGRLDCSLFMASCLISNEILSVLIRRRPHRSRRNRWRNKMEKKSISVAAAESIIKQRKVC